MKPFNLQEALAGKKVVTRDGRIVEQLHLFSHIHTYLLPLIGIIDGAAYWWAPNGSRFGGANPPANILDLFMASEKKSGWINIGKRLDGSYFIGGELHVGAVAAEHSASKIWTNHPSVKQVYVEWEE
jgi:hypothetical protein